MQTTTENSHGSMALSGAIARARALPLIKASASINVDLDKVLWCGKWANNWADWDNSGPHNEWENWNPRPPK